MTTTQLPLFFDSASPNQPTDEGDVIDERPGVEKIAHITWSYSRRSTMEKCLRNYYYEYFGASKRTAKQELNKSEIWRLKQLKNRHERTGDIFHLIISSYLRKARDGIQWDSDHLVSWARDIFKKDIAFSQTINAKWEVPKEKYPPVVLSEFYYRDPGAIEKCSSSEHRLITAIKSFMTNPIYYDFRQKGAQNGSIIEGYFKLHTVTPCKIDGRLDLAYKDDSTTRVVDWKLGNDDGVGDDSLQLAAYGLWAVETMKAPPESIRICKVHFGSEAIVNFACNSQVLSTARARIMQDAERMAFLEYYGKNARKEAFTPCVQESICRQCAYLGICDEGKEVVHA